MIFFVNIWWSQVFNNELLAFWRQLNVKITGLEFRLHTRKFLVAAFSSSSCGKEEHEVTWLRWEEAGKIFYLFLSSNRTDPRHILLWSREAGLTNSSRYSVGEIVTASTAGCWSHKLLAAKDRKSRSSKWKKTEREIALKGSKLYSKKSNSSFLWE